MPEKVYQQHKQHRVDNACPVSKRTNNKTTKHKNTKSLNTEIIYTFEILYMMAAKKA